MLRRLALAIALISTPTNVLSAEVAAEVADRDGTAIGTVVMRDTPSGQVHVVVMLENVTEGVHGIHIHETGDCSAADFTSAGGHLAGDREHGTMAEGGPHPGDLPNAHVGADGRLRVEHFNGLLNLASEGPGAVLDADGSAFIVHAGPDDYTRQPSGNAGDRIACGVFTATSD